MYVENSKEKLLASDENN